MATSEEFKNYICECLSSAYGGEISGFTCRKMMGEYLLYKNGVLFGGIYDDRFLVKKVAANEKYAMRQAIPYVGAKPMFMPEDTEDAATLKNIVEDTYSYLAAQQREKKSRKNKKFFPKSTFYENRVVQFSEK